MEVELKKLASRFYRRCRNAQDWEDMQQNIYVIYLEHKSKHNPDKSSLNTWCNNYLFKKVLTYLDSAPVRNQARFKPVDELPILQTRKVSLDFIRALGNVTKEDWEAIQKYDRKLPHHRRGPFARRIKKIAKVLTEAADI